MDVLGTFPLNIVVMIVKQEYRQQRDHGQEQERGLRFNARCATMVYF